MNLCYVCSEYPPFKHGGIGSATQVFGRALAARGHHVRAVGLYPGARGGMNPEQDNGVHVYRLPAPEGRFGWIEGRRRLYRTVAAWAAHGDIDAVEVADWEGMAAGWPALSIPVVVRLHGSLTYFAREMGGRVSKSTCLIESNSFHRADFCSSTSAYTAAMTEKLFGSHSSTPEVLYNFVEAGPLAEQAPRSTNRVVFAGSLVEKKGVIPLAEAWPAVVRRRPDAELHLYGKDSAYQGGSMKDRLIATLGPEASRSVFFHGHVTREEVAEAFRTCRMAVFPSFSEAFSLVPLEAMAEGCPVIFSKRHSGPELINPGEDGLLVEPSKPEEIAHAIVELLDNHDLAANFSQAGSRKIRARFSRQALIGRHEAFYEKCVASYRRSASQIRALSRVRLTAHA